MVNYRRNRIAGGTYFFTVNLADRCRPLLLNHISELREAVADVRRKKMFAIDAMIVLPDHFHALWTLPAGDFDYMRRVQLIKARFTRRLLRSGVALERVSAGECRLWQKRYWEHTIRDDADFQAHWNYIHINPVKHGYVRRAIDWPYSTIHRHVKNGVLTANWACAAEEGDFGE